MKASFWRQGDPLRPRSAAGYTITGEGTGGVAGFAKGSAKVELDEEGGETVLHYAVQAHVGGKLAQIGSRLIDATRARWRTNFFTRFVERMSPPAGGNGAAASEAAAAPAPRTAEPQAVPSTAPQPPGLPEELPQPQSSSTAEVPSRRLPPVVWVTGLTARRRGRYSITSPARTRAR